ncbi:MAG: hybrid sensor histidine kinase/response regulator [Leptospiraceae bacterium]|nr:hybrid sensor histidine kinase/response regulator [Leptospiraceae bacterium]MCP5495468.1 hybrid sensor histidine kinase/response regulator [Leptospiraceae bacterium]
MENNKKPLILIVDDRLDNLQVLNDTLKAANYSLAVANNGAIAIEFLKKRKPDLILLDIEMPDMDGYEVCKSIKSDQETTSIPIIFLTVKTEVDSIVKGLEYGAVDYITKPFNTKELLARVSTHIELKLSKEKLETALEQLNQKAQELDLANKTKDKFFSILSHDLSNIFGSFNNLMEIWKFYKRGAPEESFVKILVNVENSAKMGYDLLVNLLEWSRIQTGKIDFKPKKLKLKEIVEGSFKLLGNNAGTKNITLSLNIPEIATIYADPNMLGIIIRNLVSNAIKFTPSGGKVEVISEEKDGFTEISVADNGVGISQENIAKLFRIDSQHKTNGTNKERGTGLGLILCKEFIDKHNGEIWVHSLPGKGSQFFIKFPNHKEN